MRKTSERSHDGRDPVSPRARKSQPVSWENYDRNIRLHLKPALGNVKLAKLTPGRIQALYDKKRTTMSPASVKLIHAVLHKA